MDEQDTAPIGTGLTHVLTARLDPARQVTTRSSPDLDRSQLRRRSAVTRVVRRSQAPGEHAVSPISICTPTRESACSSLSLAQALR